MRQAITSIFILAAIVTTSGTADPQNINPFIQENGFDNTELQQRIERDATSLADILNSDAYITIKREQVIWIFNYLVIRYTAATQQDVYDIAIQKLTNFDQIAVFASYIQRTGNKNDAFALERMASLQLALYWRQRQFNANNNNYLFAVSYYFQQIKSWGYTNNNMSNNMTNAINNLPETLQKFFFSTNFCLKNVANGEYLFISSTDKMSDTRYFVLTTFDLDMNNEELETVIISVTDNNDGLAVNVALNHINKGMFLIYYQDNIIAAVRGNNVPANGSWSAQLVENGLVFSQNGVNICASEYLYNDSEHFVNGQMSPTTACQWVAVNCP
ncbi:uncharacterized protein LOC119674702 [Teleopsis dalmanni]|uniref:uncharacterized protein LOC119674702 n=1 Tax=Teleopsis dalmanni TaxID=139649 RepID=UPI0018CECCE6|nr:uncharacterized protein LOC119674702 [Teleopsis dalmanni]